MTTNSLPFYAPNGINFGDGTVQNSAYANANVQAFLPTYSGNLPNLTGDVTTTGNISANLVSGNGSLLSSLTGSNVTGTVAAATISATVTANNQPNITSLGNLTSVSASGNISTTGDIVGNIFTVNGLFVLNPNTLDHDYTVPVGFNAGTTGPITVTNNAIVTVPAGSAWVVN